MKAIVDTNVPVVANGKANASPTCVDRSVVALQKIILAGKIVLDDQWLILREYERNLNQSGQPGVGDAFYKWVLTHWMQPQHCERITIRRRVGSQNDFEELPNDPELQRFDPSDRKFVAVALAHPEKPPILNATDTDWWPYRTVLEKYGVQVQFLCPDAMG